MSGCNIVNSELGICLYTYYIYAKFTRDEFSKIPLIHTTVNDNRIFTQ